LDTGEVETASEAKDIGCSRTSCEAVDHQGGGMIRGPAGGCGHIDNQAVAIGEENLMAGGVEGMRNAGEVASGEGLGMSAWDQAMRMEPRHLFVRVRKDHGLWRVVKRPRTVMRARGGVMGVRTTG
jgi:hypothetical protein